MKFFTLIALVGYTAAIRIMQDHTAASDAAIVASTTATQAEKDAAQARITANNYRQTPTKAGDQAIVAAGSTASAADKAAAQARITANNYKQQDAHTAASDAAVVASTTATQAEKD